MRAATVPTSSSVDPATVSLFIGESPEQEILIPAAKSWSVRVYNHYAELESVWRKMESDGHCTVFQTYDWAACWYDSTLSSGEAKPLIVLIFEEETEPVWILPLCLHSKNGLRIISFADLGVSDYAAPVMARGAPSDLDTIKAIIRIMLGALPPCDVINFQKLSQTIEGLSNPLLSLPGLKRFPADCHGIQIREPWSVLAEKIVQPRLRSTIRKQKKSLENLGNVALEHETSPEMLRPVMDRLIALRRARFDAMGLPAMTPEWECFYQALAARNGRTLDVSVTTMTVSGETIATCFGITRRKAYHAILPTFEMGKWENFRPGILLYNAMLTDFSEKTQNEGYFDFTIGDESYKKRLGSESHPLYEWVLPRTLAGLSFYLVWRLKNFLRRYPRFFLVLKKARSMIFRCGK